MTVYDFVVTVTDLDFDDATVARFQAAGCMDAVIMHQRDVIQLDFSRSADSMQQAIDSALDDIGKVGGTILKYEFVNDYYFSQG